MSNRRNGIIARQITSLLLILALMASFCPISAYAQQVHPAVSFVIDDAAYSVDLQIINNVLYCRADQWAQAAGCLWKFNSSQRKVSFYYDTPVILCSYDDQKYVMDGDVPWIPFFEAANETGVYFSEVTEGTVYGYRAKPLAVFYDEMDRMFGVSQYRITELILQLGIFWYGISTVSRLYAVAASGMTSGFVDAVSGKMEQDMYDEIFIELVKTDESLLGSITGFGNELTRLGKSINMIQKSLDEDGELIELLEKMGFSESEIREIVWSASQEAYGNKYLNDLSDLYEANKAANLLKILGMIDDMAVSIEADAHTIMAIQEVFKDSSSTHILHAAQKAIGLRTEGKAITFGAYTIEQITDYLTDKAVNKFEDLYEEYKGIGNLEKLIAEVLTWAYDEALSLTDKSNAIMYSEAYSQIQMELVNYYYDHRTDDSPKNSLMMHSVALLYLRACLASWELFEFDDSLAPSIQNAKTTIGAEISNLMSYTEEELLQNGTSDECARAITELVRGMLAAAEHEGTVPEVTVSEATLPDADNSHLYQDAMAAYTQLLQNGVILWTDNGDYVPATHYQLVDMNLDKLPEMVVFTVKDYVSLFHIYAYREDSVWWIGDSLNTCDISTWYNAGHDLYICEGNYLYASAVKSTVGYTAGSSGFLRYDGSDVAYVPSGINGSTIYEKLIESSEIVGGIRIEDTVGNKLADGEYYGCLQSWDQNSVTVELYEFLGWNEMYMYREFAETGKTVTLDIGASSVWLEWAWGETGNDIKCKSIDAALDTKIWGGGTTVRENCTMQIYFTAEDGIVKQIVFLYAA